MKRLLFLATATLMALLILMPITMAQEEEAAQEETVTEEETVVEEAIQEEEAVQEETVTRESPQSLPKSGGPALGSVLLPATALLVGSGILAYAVLRRR